MAPLHVADSNGVFKSPLGDYDFSLEKWTKIEEFLKDIFVKDYPSSTLTEAKTDRKITYNKLYEVGESVADQLKLHGVRSRSILHLVGENCLDWLAVLLGCFLNDCIISATHPNSPWPEFSRNITTTCATVLVMTRKSFEKSVARILFFISRSIYLFLQV